MQSYQAKSVDIRALAWLDGEINKLENFKVERWDGRRWTELTE